MAIGLQLPWLGGGKPVKIAVVGDLILDEYLDGDVTRISPEAPVPVHLVKKVSLTAGGAANVARNIQLVGGNACLFGVYGKDAAAEELRSLLANDGVDTTHIVTALDRPTIKKTRIYSQNQQIVRVDWERIHPVNKECQEQLAKALREAKPQAFLVSDYGKGALTDAFLRELINFANEQKIPVVVDPKGKDYTRYKGCSLITPNRKEACEALDLSELCEASAEELARSLQKRYGLNDVLITLGADGMYLLSKDADQGQHLPSRAREVFDVSGAGDTVAAMMTLALASGATGIEAMHIANVAAGVVVEKLGTQPITLRELEVALSREKLSASPHDSRLKVTTIEDFAQVRSELKVRGERLVMTNGCFDLLHAGHVSYLEAARALGDRLIVALNSDASISRLKGSSRPIVGLRHRMAVVAALGCVDYVVAFDQDTPAELIAKIVPDVLVKGADWEVGAIVGGDIVKAAGGEVRNIDLVPGLSTSQIVEKIKGS